MISVQECETSLRRMQEQKRQQGTALIEMGCISPANLAYALQWWVFGLFAAFMWWRMATDAVDVETDVETARVTSPHD